MSKTEIRKLVEAFRTNWHQLKESDVPEADIRQDYINHFWELLGWDIRNKEHKSPAQKDVIVERSFSTSEESRIRIKRPDYLFKIDGFPRFIVEAKKLTVDITSHKESIFQAKSYSWSSQIPFAVLTNFEQFRIFDATIKPYNTEPEKGVIPDFDLRFEDYENQWDIIENTFSRQAVANGSLENLLAKIKKVRAGRRIRGIDRMLIDLKGSEPVDKAFLKHLEEYRLRFARAIYADNRKMFPDATTKHGAAKLTEVTQRLIDRLVFIRVCEDRGITPYGELRSIVNASVKDGLDLYDKLCAKFRSLDEQYNGKLFKAHISEQLTIPAQLVADFIRSLYFPDGPYRFHAIGDDILGIIYERFLGSTITIDSHNNVDATEKPEVRHAGGVYYTPKFVVDTIVRRVVGPKIQGKTPAEILKLTILDPACGSGSFLIAALQYLYDYCTEYLNKHPKDNSLFVKSGKGKRRKINIGFQDNEGIWHTSPEFRSQLLSSCIYGVDIDMQAVEVTVMSLYLKMLEEQLPPHWQREFLRHKLLPSLDNNINRGNSLISQTDFDRYWETKHSTLFGFDDDTRFRINAFDWTSETRGFGRILNDEKGFDCIIGNPPYIRVQELKRWAPEECEFYKATYKSAAKGNYDIYVVFIEKALQLLNPNGLMGYICPHKFWQAKYGEGIREIIVKGKHLKSIIDFTDQQVFKGATTYTAIHIFSNIGNNNILHVARLFELIDGNSQCLLIERGHKIEHSAIFNTSHPTTCHMWSFNPPDSLSIEEDINNNRLHLSELVDFSQGFKTGADKVFVVDFLKNNGSTISIYSQALAEKYTIESSIVRPLIKSEHMKRYEISQTNLLLIFPYIVVDNKWRIIEPDELKDAYPLTFAYFEKLRSQLDRRESGKFAGDHFYQYSRQQNFVPLSKAKIVSPDMADKPRFSYDNIGKYVFSGGAAGGVCIIPKKSLNPLYLLGLLNSSLIHKLIKQKNGVGFRGGYLNCEIRFLRNIPIQLPNCQKHYSIQEKLCEFVQKIIDKKVTLQKPTISDQERQQLEREIEAYENRIDELVCKLYGVDKIPDLKYL